MKKKAKNQDVLPIRHSRTELIILVGIIAILSLLIMFLKYPF